MSRHLVEKEAQKEIAAAASAEAEEEKEAESAETSAGMTVKAAAPKNAASRIVRRGRVRRNFDLPKPFLFVFSLSSFFFASSSNCVLIELIIM